MRSSYFIRLARVSHWISKMAHEVTRNQPARMHPRRAVTKENEMAKRNAGGKASDGILERSADRIGEALGTAVRTMEDLGGRVAGTATDLAGRAAETATTLTRRAGNQVRGATRRATRKASKSARSATKRVKAGGRRTLSQARAAAARARRSIKQTRRKKR
jgi:hypothetical protein